MGQGQAGRGWPWDIGVPPGLCLLLAASGLAWGGLLGVLLGRRGCQGATVPVPRRGAEPGDPSPAGEPGAAEGERLGAGAGAGNAGGEPDAAAAARCRDSRSPGGPVCQPECDTHGSVGDDGGRLAGPRWHPGRPAPAAAGALGAQRLGVLHLPPRLAAARGELLPVRERGRGVGAGPGALPGAGGPAGRHRGPPGAGLPGGALPPPRLLDRAPRPQLRGLLPVGGREPQHLPELALGAAGRGGGGRGLCGHGPAGGVGGPALRLRPGGVGLRAGLGLLTPPGPPRDPLHPPLTPPGPPRDPLLTPPRPPAPPTDPPGTPPGPSAPPTDPPGTLCTPH